MHQYRINYFLLFGLAAVFVVVGGIAFFVIHPWQVNRNAEWFRERSESAIAENDPRTAFDYLAKYYRFRKDEDDALIKLANLGVEVTKLEDATGGEYRSAHKILKHAVVKTNDPALRRELADALIKGGRPGDALVHIDELLKNDPSNSELQALRVRSLFATKDYRQSTELAYSLIGYDKKSKTFDAEKAIAADQPEIYTMLAATLVEIDKKPEQARLVIDQMVEANPESHEAHLKRSVFLLNRGEKEEANLALAKAYELNPTDADVLMRMGQVALSEKDYDKAYQHLAEGLENYPRKIAFYKLLALTETQRGNTSEALVILDRGIEEFGLRRSLILVLDKIGVLFRNKDLAEVNNILEVLEELKIASLEPLIAYQRTRIKWHNEQWAEAVNEFKRLRPKLFQFPEAQTLAGIMLGRAYERLGQSDLAEQTYNSVLQDRPNDPRAMAGLRRVSKQTRRGDSRVPQGFNVGQLVRQILALPKKQQDWERVDTQIAEFVEKNKLPESAGMLYQAQVFLERKMYLEAREKIRAAAKVDPENLNVRLAAVKLLWLEPDTSSQKALANLDQVEKKFGDSLQTRILRAKMVAASDEENIPEQLSSLAEGIEDWDDRDKVQIYVYLARELRHLGKNDDALDFVNRAAQLAPNNLPVRMQLFDVAMQKNDDEAMQSAQRKILEIVKSKEDASYIITEVKRLILGYGKDQVTREELLEARAMLDAAMQQRPEWSLLHVTYGQLLLVLQVDLDIALERLNDALKFGPPNMGALSLHIKLLANQGQYQEAREKMGLMSAEIREKMLGKVNAEVLLRTGDAEEAFEAAQKIADQQPQQVTTQKWFAVLANTAGKTEAAAKAWQKVVELNPTEPDSWSQLLTIYARQKNLEQLLHTIRQAHLALDAEFVPLLTAKTYELQGRWQNAEALCLAAYGDRLNEIPIARRMADFYLLWSSKNPANAKKAALYVNRILRASYEGNVPPQYMHHVAWARRQAARLLAATGDYQKNQQALRLLMLAKVDGELPAEDQAMRGGIMASLKDPASQAQAIQVLSEMRKKGQLKKKLTLSLAGLMFAAGDWKSSENILLDALATYDADPEVRSTYINLLIEHGDYDIAQSRLNRIKNTAAYRGIYLQLLARLSAKKGDQAGVRKSLTALLPDDLEGSLEPPQLALVRSVARLASKYDDTALAEKLYTLFAQRVPSAAFELTRFHALYGNIDTALEQMKKAPPKQRNQSVALAAQMLRKRRAEFGDKYDEPVNRFMAAALRDDPESALRLLTQAEILEIQQKYEESANAYDKLLKRDDVPVLERAAASNNLAFMLALMGQRLGEAETLVNQAIEFYGPLASLLDTRGVVRIANKQYDLALEDLRLAVTVEHPPLTQYHLAKALLLTGDKEAAQKRWKEARKRGLKEEDVPTLERAGYEEFAKKIQQI
ncbi:MAG: tetratricopeptide repeat protein [Planctomycetes bacterium]|nr:tetratricopeptide repeat protein [Planctomycetota bacterium]